MKLIRSSLNGSLLLLGLFYYLNSGATAVAAPDGAIWVSKSDNAVQCGSKKDVIPLSVAQAELKKSKIRVYARKKIHDDRPRIQSCGTDSGSQNAFLVDPGALDQALAIGYQKIVKP